MNNYIDISKGWREKIASMGPPGATEISDKDIEKAFADQAASFIENRVGDLIKDDHRIGFEIVKKSDDNTKIIGIFAFKVGNELVFAPVFFLNGDIKGSLLYRCDTRQFVPANKDWADYLISALDSSYGEGTDISMRANTPPRVDLYKAVAPPGGGQIKHAFYNAMGMHTTGWYEEMTKQADAILDGSGILKEFLKEGEIGRQATAIVKKAMNLGDAFELADTLAASYGSGDKLVEDVESVDPELTESIVEQMYEEGLDAELTAEEFRKEVARRYNATFEKEASVNKPELFFDYSITKSAAKNVRMFTDGFVISDSRDKSKLSEIRIVEDSEDMSAVTHPGKYAILANDGSIEKDVLCFMLPKSEDCYGFKENATKSQRVLAIKDGKAIIAPIIIGKLQDTIAAKYSEPVAGNMYLIVVDNQPSVIVNIINTDNVDGVKIFKCSSYHSVAYVKADGTISSYNLFHSRGLRETITYNKNLPTSKPDKDIYGANAKFIKLNSKGESGDYAEVAPLDNLMTGDSVEKFIFNRFDLPTVKVTLNKQAGTYTFTDVLSGDASRPMSKNAAFVKLARDMRIGAEDVYAVQDKLDETGECTFLYSSGMDKEASRLHMVERPIFDESYDAELGLRVVPAQEFAIPMAGDQIFPPSPRIGDASNPTTPSGLSSAIVVSHAPEQLRDLADKYKLPNVFEHAAVGTLAETFDAIPLIQKYVPRMLECIDALGRTKFLINWKPDDFDRAYGSDDMLNIEAELDSTFEGLGNFTLKMLKRNDRIRKGDVKDNVM